MQALLVRRQKRSQRNTSHSVSLRILWATTLECLHVKSLAPGFLIAMPRLNDPNFERSVVLMIEHNEVGSMGLVINRPMELSLDDVGKSQKLAVAARHGPDAVYQGGPVEPYRGFVLHDGANVSEKTTLVPGLYLSVTSDSLEPLLTEHGGRLRFCLGYAGWGPGQLARELREGSWLFTEAQADAVLHKEAGQMWEDTIKSMGFDPAMLLAAQGSTVC
jgi:putative transcriptional regulator